MKYLLIVFSCIFLSSVSNSQEYNPVANPASVVSFGNARFTVLTPGVIRMEWAADAKFADNASLTFVNRNLPVPAFTKKVSKNSVTIKTEKLTMVYSSPTDSFSTKNLSVSFVMDGKAKIWKPGTPNNGNLLGTTRTLDRTNGDIYFESAMSDKFHPLKLEQGIVSRDGWMMIDDTQRPYFDNSDWTWVMARPVKKQQDMYFFAYGNDYRTAMADYTKIGGHIAMPPKFAFGAWWSRYFQYTDMDFRNLVDEFEIHDVPLDVLVMDMDWHVAHKKEWYNADGSNKKDQAGQNFGWTGFSWSKDFFSNPNKFMEWTNDKNLQTCLNLHPASGVQPHEDQYEPMAKAMGIDPATKKYVPFDITDKKFASSYMDSLLRPLEKQGVDFWWLDWQQWGGTKIPGVNPTFYLNYVHYSDMERQNKVRPLIFHRWGGLGNHRYQIGFSGDTHITWTALAYQPGFTATAANVGFGYWSHDIGGHYHGKNNAELFTRWVQWGAFSPIMRTHSSSDPTTERRIWAYPLENFKAMRSMYLMRYSLVPYIYSQVRKAYETGISICHPMYYDSPKDENAYAFKDQYMFGDDMLVSPITKPLGADSLFVSQKIWLPKGQWYELCTGTLFKGDRVIERPYALEEIPVFVREGAIITQQPKMNRVDEKKLNPVILSIYPGQSGSTFLYEDEGNNNNFKSGAFAKTDIRFVKTGKIIKVTIDGAKGDFSGMLKERSYELRFPCSFPAKSVKVNGVEVAYKANAAKNTWNYNGTDLSTIVYTSDFGVRQKTEIEVEFIDDDLSQLSGKKGLFSDLLKATHTTVVNYLNRSQFDIHDLVRASQTAQALSYSPDAFIQEMNKFKTLYPSAIQLLESSAEVRAAYKPMLELLRAKSKE